MTCPVCLGPLNVGSPPIPRLPSTRETCSNICERAYRTGFARNRIEAQR